MTTELSSTYIYPSDDAIVPTIIENSREQSYDVLGNTLSFPKADKSMIETVTGRLLDGKITLGKGIKEAQIFVESALNNLSDEEVLYSFDNSIENQAQLSLSQKAAQKLLSSPDVAKILDIDQIEIIAGSKAESKINAQTLTEWEEFEIGDKKISSVALRSIAHSIVNKMRNYEQTDYGIRIAIHEAEHYKAYTIPDDGVIREIVSCHSGLLERIRATRKLSRDPSIKESIMQISKEGSLFSSFDEAVAIMHEIFGDTKIESMNHFSGDAILPRLGDVLSLFSIGATQDTKDRRAPIMRILSDAFTKGIISPDYAQIAGILMIIMPEGFVDLSKKNFINWQTLISQNSSNGNSLSFSDMIKSAALTIFERLKKVMDDPESFGADLLRPPSRMDALKAGFQMCKLRLSSAFLDFQTKSPEVFPDNFNPAVLEQFVNSNN